MNSEEASRIADRFKRITHFGLKEAFQSRTHICVSGKNSKQLNIKEQQGIILIKLKLNLWLTAPKGATPVN